MSNPQEVAEAFAQFSAACQTVDLNRIQEAARRTVQVVQRANPRIQAAVRAELGPLLPQAKQ